MSADEYTDEELLALEHNDHAGAFQGYLNGSRHSADKQAFLTSWLRPAKDDVILECGSSSGKTSIDFVRKSSCFCLGVDFDPEAVKVASALRDEHFPELMERCSFECGDLAVMELPHDINKIIMPDFSEHIPDRVFSAILSNLGTQTANTLLYIYTPNRSHIFEIMKSHNFILKNPPGHINVKSRRALASFLVENGWEVVENSWRPSSFPVIRIVEQIFGWIPIVGGLFQRRIAVVARFAKTKV